MVRSSTVNRTTEGSNPPPHPNKYWYKFYIEECCLCGVTHSWKERMYTPKPEDAGERYDYNNNLACDYHFM